VGELERLRALCAEQATALQSRLRGPSSDDLRPDNLASPAQPQTRRCGGALAPLLLQCFPARQPSAGSSDAAEQQRGWLWSLGSLLPCIPAGSAMRGGEGSGGGAERDTHYNAAPVPVPVPPYTPPSRVANHQVHWGGKFEAAPQVPPLAVPVPRGRSSLASPGASPRPSTGGWVLGSPTRAAVAEASAAAQRQARSSAPGGSPASRSAARLASTPNAPGSAVARLRPHELRVHAIGWLTKFSRGGLTSNWNRRAFGLIGSSLFYARSIEELVVSPKRFAQLDAGAVAQPWPREEGRNLFSLTTGGGEVLLIEADSAFEMHEWIGRLMRARFDPLCDASNVAPLIHYSLGSGSLFQQVILARADDQLLPSQGYSSGGASPAPARGARAPPALADELTSRPAGLMLDQWLPPFLRDFI